MENTLQTDPRVIISMFIGANYGLVFTAWGAGGFLLALLADKMYDKHQTFVIAYYGASILLVLAAITVFFLKPPHHTIEHAHEHEHD